MGGLVARQYIESADYQNDIDQLITLATPQNGAPIMYPMWEAGAFLKASVLDYLVEQYFKIEAAESGHFLDTFGYIRNRPVVSVQELLPVYNYLYDQDNNGELRQYPNNYPQNSFIENLNKSENIEKLRDVEFDKIIGNLESDFKTYTGFNLVSYDGDENVWQDGIPDGFPSQGTIKNVGDKIVPLESAKSDNIPSDEYFEINADHNGTPTEAQQDVLELLTGSRPQSEVRRSPIKDLLIVSVFSPVDVQVIAPDGAKIGKDFATGQIVNEIPDAYYTGYNTVSEFLTIPNPTDGEYKVLTQGTGSGNYAIKATKIVQNDQNTVATESTVTIQGITTLNQREQVDILLQGDEVKENSDNLSPRTTILINGQTPKEFYNDHAAITLSATDFAQTGTDSAGVLSINYRLDGAATTTLGTTTTIAVVNEGKHTLSYRAKDKLGNDEEEKNISFVIDKTSPELKFGFSQTKKDLAFSAADNYSASNTIAIVDKNGSLIATDQAGNTVELSFKEKNRKQSLRAQLLGLSYNGQMVDLSGSQLALAWFYGYTPKLPLLLTGLQLLPPIPKTLPKPGPLSFLLQQAKLKDGSFIVALFGNNKTLLLEYKNKKLNLKTFSGLKLLDFATNKGKLEWSY